MKYSLKLISVLLLGVVVAFSLFSIIVADQNNFALAATSSTTKINLGSGTLPNQAGGISDVRGLARTVINVLLGLATTVAVIFIIIGGYQYIGSGASEDLKAKSKKTLMWAISGLIVIILAAVLVNTIISALK